MKFWPNAFRNIIKGALYGLGIGIGLYILGTIVAATYPTVVTPGWRRRGVELVLFVAIWGVPLGFFCTRPERPSRITSALLVLFAVITSVALWVAFQLAIIRTQAAFVEILGIALLIGGGIAAFICGFWQFYEGPKSADRAE